MNRLFGYVKDFAMGIVGALMLVGIIYGIGNYELFLFSLPYFITFPQAFGILIALIALRFTYQYVLSDNAVKTKELQDQLALAEQINTGHHIVLAAIVQYCGGTLSVPKYIVTNLSSSGDYNQLQFAYDEVNKADVFTIGGNKEIGESNIN